MGMSHACNRRRAQKLHSVCVRPRTRAVHVRQPAQQLPRQGLGQGLVQARGRVAQQVPQVPRAQLQHQRAAAALRRPWLPASCAWRCPDVLPCGALYMPSSALAHSHQPLFARLLPCMPGASITPWPVAAALGWQHDCHLPQDRPPVQSRAVRAAEEIHL